MLLYVSVIPHSYLSPPPHTHTSTLVPFGTLLTKLGVGGAKFLPQTSNLNVLTMYQCDF